MATVSLPVHEIRIHKFYMKSMKNPRRKNPPESVEPGDDHRLPGGPYIFICSRPHLFGWRVIPPAISFNLLLLLIGHLSLAGRFHADGHHLPASNHFSRFFPKRIVTGRH